MKILLLDRSAPEALALSRFKSVFSIRTGIFSELERLQIQYPDSSIHYYHPDKDYLENICKLHEFISIGSKNRSIIELEGFDAEKIRSQTEYDSIIDSQQIFSVFNLLDEIDSNLEKDLKLNKTRIDDFIVPANIDVLGKENVKVHRSVKILPGSVINAENGPVIIDEGTVISPFSYLEGPLYIGPDCRIDDARIGGGSIIGRAVRAGGEIENSIFGDFTNKHHEGFTGHSILGDWVNLGALTTTSDLKNNYGKIRIQVKDIEIQTNRIKLGSLIGDCVKTAIGTMINTGTVIDAGSNIFGPITAKYLPPFSWGTNGQKYNLSRFLSDTEKIFARRNQSLQNPVKELIEQLSTKS